VVASKAMLAACLTLLVTLPALAVGAAPAWSNGGFEDGPPGAEVPGWTVTPGSKAEVRIDATAPGRQSLALARGAVSQKLGVEGLAGHRAVIGLQVRPEDEAIAELQVVARSKGERVWVRRALLRGSDWSPAGLGVELPEADALELELTVTARGKGGIHVDAVELTDLGRLPPVETAPLSAGAAERIRAFSTLYAQVRWFHPADATLVADWDAIAEQGVAAAEQTEDLDALAQQWQALLAPVAPTVQVWYGEAPAAVAPAGGDRSVAWYHLGSGLSLALTETGRPSDLNSSVYRRFRVDDQGAWWSGVTRTQTLDTLDARAWQGQTLRLEVEAEVEGGLDATVGLRVPGSESGMLSPRMASGTTELLFQVPDRAEEVDVVLHLSGPGALELRRVELGPRLESPVRQLVSFFGLLGLFSLLSGSFAMAGAVYSRRTIGGFVSATIVLTLMAFLAGQDPQLARWLPFPHLQNVDALLQQDPVALAGATEDLGEATSLGHSLLAVVTWILLLFAAAMLKMRRMEVRGGGD